MVVFGRIPRDYEDRERAAGAGYRELMTKYRNRGTGFPCAASSPKKRSL
jgi:hypothetical protein